MDEGDIEYCRFRVDSKDVAWYAYSIMQKNTLEDSEPTKRK